MHEKIRETVSKIAKLSRGKNLSDNESLSTLLIVTLSKEEKKKSDMKRARQKIGEKHLEREIASDSLSPQDKILNKLKKQR